MVRIAIDMDEVIADFTAKLLQLYNEKYGASYTKSDLAGINLRIYVLSMRRTFEK